MMSNRRRLALSEMMRQIHTGWWLAVWWLAVWGLCLEAFGNPPAPTLAADSGGVSLHEQIDALIESRLSGPVAPICSDATFIRRVSLDLTGRIPPAEQVREFLGDESVEKRSALVDRLLTSPEHARHFSEWLDVMLLERRRQTQVTADEWKAYLLQSIRDGKPYNVLAAELIANDGVDLKNRAAASFVLDRDVEANLLTRDVGRIFFGRDLQCAQCHDHPLIAGYHQRDYYGIYAFLHRSTKFTDTKLKKDVIADQATGDADFTSVFTGDSDLSRPRLPGSAEVLDPQIEPGREYQVKPAKNVRGVPTYSRRLQLAEALQAGNPVLARTLANRLWAALFRRGLIHPLDLDHPENPPVHPDVLEILTQAVVEHEYRIKPILAQLVRTRAYQRSFMLPDESQLDPARLAAALQALEPVIAESGRQLEAAERLAGEALETRNAAQQAFESVQSRLSKVDEQLAAVAKSEEPLRKAVEKASALLTQQQAVAESLESAIRPATAATRIVPDDQELQQVLGVLNGRLEAARAVLEKAQAEMKTQTAKWRPLQQQLADLQRDRDKLRDELSTVAEPFAGSRRRYQQLRAERDRAEESLTWLKRREANLLQEQQLASLLGQQTESAGQLAKLQIQLPLLQSKRQELNEQLVAAQNDHDRKSRQLSELKNQRTLATSRMQESDRQIELLTEANLAVREVVAQDAARTEIAQAAARLESSLQRHQQLREKQARQLQQLDESAEAMVPVMKQAALMLEAVREKHAAVVAELAQLTEQRERLLVANESVEAQLNAVRQAVAESWSAEFRVAAVDGLTPEQLGWSTMQALGVLAAQRTAAIATLNKAEPLNGDQAMDPAVLADREWKVEQQVYDKLKGNLNEFVQLFGAGPGQPQGEFFATADQALFFANGSRTDGWLNALGDNLAARLIRQPDAGLLAEELYLSLLSRLPDPAEVQAVVDYLEQQGTERPGAVRELIWGLLTSAEFRFHH